MSQIMVEISVRPTDGVLCGAYFRFRSGKVEETREIVRDSLLADYDKQGRLVGIDVLGPVEVDVVVRLLDDPKERKALRNLMQNRIGDLLRAA